MAAAVLQPLSNLSLDNGIMAPSPISPTASRHGRRGSVAKINKGRARGYSVVDERETMVFKALTRVMKRTVEKGEEEEDDEKLVADAEGWVDCEDLLEQPYLEALQVTLSELRALVASANSKSRFTLKLKSKSSEAEDLEPSDYLIRLTPATNGRPTSPTSASSQQLTPLTLSTPSLPSLIIYETSYANYPLILAAGNIKRAGGQAHLSFTAQTESTPSSSDADVSIFLPLEEIMNSNPEITWARTESGTIVTEGDSNGSIPKSLWKKAVARRADIGVLYEDGEVRKEIPVGLRGKGAKGKKGGKGKGLKKVKAGSEEGSASD